jgi:hypothetical protein
MEFRLRNHSIEIIAFSSYSVHVSFEALPSELHIEQGINRQTFEVAFRLAIC